MRTCPFCSAPVADDATVCFSCARELPAARPRACSDCGRPVNAAADYCLWCGHALRAGLTLICRRCGQENATDAAYCRRCGQLLGRQPAAARCVVCQRALPAQALFCPACGASQIARPMRSCPACRREIPRESQYCPYCRAPAVRAVATEFKQEATAPAPAAPRSTNNIWMLVILVAAVGTLAVLAYLLADSQRARPAAVPPPILAVNTAKGSIAVGAPAYMDGSGLDAWEPATLARIPVWDLAPGQHIVCELAHSAPVQVLAIVLVESERRHYFRVQSEVCEGWVPEPALGAVRRAPVGQQS